MFDLSTLLTFCNDLVQCDVWMKNDKYSIDLCSLCRWWRSVCHRECFLTAEKLSHRSQLPQWTTEKCSWASSRRRKCRTMRCCRTPTRWTLSPTISCLTSKPICHELFSWETSKSAAVTGPDSSASLYSHCTVSWYFLLSNWMLCSVFNPEVTFGIVYQIMLLTLFLLVILNLVWTNFGWINQLCFIGKQT